MKQTFFRFLGKIKLYSLINLLGLAVSLMFVIIIGDFCVRTMDVDRSYSRSGDICIIGIGDLGYPAHYVVTSNLAEHLPEVEKKCSVAGGDKLRIRVGSEEDGDRAVVMLTDSTFFDFFEFPVICGDPRTALDAPDKAVITESMAMKLFGRKEVLGEEIFVKGNSEEFPLTVSAVIDDLKQTVLDQRTQVITLIGNCKRIGYTDFLDTGNFLSGYNSPKTFLMLAPGADLTDRLPFINEFYLEHDLGVKYFATDKNCYVTKLTDLMMDPHNINCGLEKGERTILWVLLTAGLAILLFAVTNYINLTLAQTGGRAKEMACRRLLGESAASVASRLLKESLLMTVLAFAIGFGLALLVEDKASELVLLRIDLLESLNLKIGLYYTLFIVITAFLSGILPAYAISRYKPVDIVKGTFRYDSKMIFSKVFIFLQYAAAFVMIVAASTIYLQIRHMIKAPLGHESENIVEMQTKSIGEQRCATLEDELSKLPFVEKVGRVKGASFFSQSRMMMGFTDDKGESHMIDMAYMDRDLMDVMGLECVFDYGFSLDGRYLNESAAALFGVKEGDTSYSMGGVNSEPLCGVVKDFKLGSVLEDIKPMVILTLANAAENTADDDMPGMNYLYIKVADGGDRDVMLKAVMKTYEDVCGEECMGADFAETTLASYFEKDRNILKLIVIFSLIAILISSLGLFAISMHFTRERSKEMTLRKIFGGPKRTVMLEHLLKMTAPLMLSFVVSVPLAWFVMDFWLNGYSYRMDQPLWLYVAAAVFVILLGLVSVLSETLKVVNRNPVESIRTE